MRRSAREAVAQTANRAQDLAEDLRRIERALGDAESLGEYEAEAAGIEGLSDEASSMHGTLAMLLERDELEREVREVDHARRGGRVKVKMTRGDSVREMDEWTIQGEGPTSADAAAEFEANLERYEDEWADRVRDLDPYGGGG